jgi:tetratricopeptide (TPR) repeat protein
MTCVRVALCILVTLTVQADDLHQRLLRTLGPETDQKAEALLKAEHFADVESLVADVRAETSAAQSEKWALRGALNFLSGRMEGAVQCFQQAAELGELHESDRFTLAMAWVRLGRDEDARRELTRLATEQPRTALYVYWLGRIDYDQRRYQEAVGYLKTATALDAKSARAWDSLGLAFDMQGNADQALQAFEEGARVNREQAHGSAWPPHDLGVLLLRIGQTKRAEAAFREALQYDPQMEQAHYHLGRALDKEGVNDEAASEYVIAMNEDKKAADVCYSLATLYRRMHREQDASAMFAEWRRRRDAQP